MRRRIDCAEGEHQFIFGRRSDAIPERDQGQASAPQLWSGAEKPSATKQNTADQRWPASAWPGQRLAATLKSQVSKLALHTATTPSSEATDRRHHSAHSNGLFAIPCVAAGARRNGSRTVCQRPWGAQHQHWHSQSLVSFCFCFCFVLFLAFFVPDCFGGGRSRVCS